jgi:hypothetical protein
MTSYEVTFERNGIYHSNIVRTEKSPIELSIWYKENKPGTFVHNISIATSESMKPGKPIIEL